MASSRSHPYINPATAPPSVQQLVAFFHKSGALQTDIETCVEELHAHSPKDLPSILLSCETLSTKLATLASMQSFVAPLPIPSVTITPSQVYIVAYTHALTLVNLNRFDEARSMLTNLAEVWEKTPAAPLLLAWIDVIDPEKKDVLKALQTFKLWSQRDNVDGCNLAAIGSMLLGSTFSAEKYANQAISIACGLREDPRGWVCARGTKAQVLGWMLRSESHKAQGRPQEEWLSEIKAAVKEDEGVKRFAGEQISLTNLNIVRRIVLEYCGYLVFTQSDYHHAEVALSTLATTSRGNPTPVAGDDMVAGSSEALERIHVLHEYSLRFCNHEKSLHSEEGSKHVLSSAFPYGISMDDRWGEITQASRVLAPDPQSPSQVKKRQPPPEPKKESTVVDEKPKERPKPKRSDPVAVDMKSSGQKPETLPKESPPETRRVDPMGQTASSAMKRSSSATAAEFRRDRPAIPRVTTQPCMSRRPVVSLRQTQSKSDLLRGRTTPRDRNQPLRVPRDPITEAHVGMVAYAAMLVVGVALRKRAREERDRRRIAKAVKLHMQQNEELSRLRSKVRFVPKPPVPMAAAGPRSSTAVPSGTVEKVLGTSGGAAAPKRQRPSSAPARRPDAATVTPAATAAAPTKAEPSRDTARMATNARGFLYTPETSPTAAGGRSSAKPPVATIKRPSSARVRPTAAAAPPRATMVDGLGGEADDEFFIAEDDDPTAILNVEDDLEFNFTDPYEGSTAW